MTEKDCNKPTKKDKTGRTELLSIPDSIKQKLIADFFVNVSYYFSENFAEIVNIQEGDAELIKAKIESLDNSEVLYTKHSKCVLYSSIEKIINSINSEVPIVSNKLYSMQELDLLLKSRGYYNFSDARRSIPKIYGGSLDESLPCIYHYSGVDIKNFILKMDKIKVSAQELSKTNTKAKENQGISIFTSLKNAVIKLFKD